MNIARITGRVLKARGLALKKQLSTNDSYPEFSLDFYNIGILLDSALVELTGIKSGIVEGRDGSQPEE